MAEKLMIQSIVTDNRITAQFSDKQLPRYARHGELYVVNGILFIYADLDNSNHGRWFPLTDQKEIYTYETTNASNIWTIPIDFQTDNIQIIVYDEQDKIYVKDFTVDVDADQVQIVFEESVAGQAYLVINKAFDWVDRRFIVADRNFAVTENELVPNEYFMEINTKYVEMLKNGNTTLKSDLTVGGALNVTGATTFTGDQTLGGNVDIGGNLSVGGTITVVNKLIAQDILELTSDLLVGGNAVINGVLYATELVETSAKKFKTNIKPIESALETIEKLNGVTYEWIESGKSDIGFIVDEVNEVLPEIVQKSENGEVEGMNYGRLTSMLVEAVKELSAIVKQQQIEIENLKNK